MRKLSVLVILAASFLGAVAHASYAVKVPASVRQELRNALKATGTYKNATKPTIRISAVMTNRSFGTATATLMGLGHGGAFKPGLPLVRIARELATVKFGLVTQKPVGEVKLKPVYQLFAIPQGAAK